MNRNMFNRRRLLQAGGAALGAAAIGGIVSPASARAVTRAVSLTGTGRTVDTLAAVDPILAEVNPLIGTVPVPGGATIPGAARPFGLVTATPHTLNADTSGYNFNRDIVGIAHTSVSGTGGASKYGNARITPMAGAPRLTSLASGKAEESAAPGYYSVRLMRDDVHVETTATRRVGVHRWTFPQGKDAFLSLDATAVVFDALTSSQPPSNAQRPTAATISVSSPTEITATATFTGGWNPGAYTIYLVWRLDRPVRSAQVWRDNVILTGSSATSGSGQRLGVLAKCDPGSGGVVHSWLAISFVSVGQARQNLDAEVGGQGFEEVLQEAQLEWSQQLGAVTIEGGTSAQRTIFRTALYHASAMPHDVSGENVWTAGATHYEDFYVLWDIARMVLPLHALIAPDRLGAMLQSLVEVYRSTGWMPNGRIAGHNGNTRGGTFGDLAIWDARVKNITGIDYATAYQALRKNALTPSPDIDTVGRADVAEYAQLGYIPVEFSVSGKFNGGRMQTSRSVEYTLCDNGIAGLADALGNRQDAELFRDRARWWTRSWDPTTRCLRPRKRDGGFVTPFDPDAGTAHFYEGSARQYTTAVQHDVDHLIALLGGDPAMVAWLDAFFDNGRYNPGNETDLLAPYYYIHAGRHDRTVDRMRTVLAQEYAAAPFGLPSPSHGGGSGNDDSGAISAAYLWGAMGLCPNAGQPWYYLGSPIFEHITLRAGGVPFRIDAVGTSDQRRYVRSATLNGQPLRRAWLLHQEIVAGGTLTLQMSDQRGSFGSTGPRPPRSDTVPTALYGNIGVSNDTATTLANLDGTGNSYSAQALAAAGVTPGSKITANSVTFTWPNVTVGQPDNHAANGQRIATSGSGAIAFLGSATNGPSSGTATVTYTDGTKQSIPLAFSDWTLSRSTTSPVPGNTIAKVTGTYRNTPTGAQQMKTYIFATTPAALTSGKHVASVKLPSNVNTGVLHVFAIGFTAP